jgi:hypothetical protein
MNRETDLLKPKRPGGFWPLFWLLAVLWLVAVVIWGCPGAVPVKVEAPIRATGVHVGADSPTTAGRDVWNFDFSGWAVGGLASLAWLDCARDRRRRDHIAKTVVKAIDIAEAELPKSQRRVKRTVEDMKDKAVDRFVQRVSNGGKPKLRIV